MPWRDPEGDISSHTAWRAFIVIIAAVLIFLVIPGGVLLVLSNRDLASKATEAALSSRDLSCRIGAFFVGQPIVRQPEQSEADFRQTVAKAESFLRALKTQDCTQVKGARVTPQQIHRALHNLHRAVPSGQASIQPTGGGSSGTSPPSTPGSGSTAPPAPAPEPSPSPQPEPRPGPPPPPPPPPPPSPGPPPKPCIVNALGICVPNPLP